MNGTLTDTDLVACRGWMKDRQEIERATPNWLADGGEMSERIRAFDWSKTPLGPIETWSPSLKMMVRFLLANRFPLLLWWGPQFVQIYNDAYRPVLGTKHPSPGLGRPVSECWSEIWHILRPLIEAPFNGGSSTWMEDILLEINRHGFTEETHFTIAYSPVPDETVPSGIGGVLATVHEITEKVVGERRVVALRDLGARVGEAKCAEESCRIAAKALAAHDRDVPFVLLYLLDADRKYVHLHGSSGVPDGKDVSPATIELSAATGDGWPFAQALRTGAMQVVEGLKERFQTVPSGPWSDPPNTAVVVPIPSNKADEPAGVMIAGVSARLRLDEFYRGFFELVRTQVAAGIANARAYEEERKRAEALAEIDRAKTAFFSNVSHEFRTPLTLMLGPVEELLSRSQTELSPSAQETLKLVNRNGFRLLRLVNTLLDFSRIEAGRAEAVFEPTDLPALTAEVTSMFRAATDKAGLRLEANCHSLPEPVFVDRDMWEKIVLNLIANALKFTFEGKIEVTLEKVENSAELRVRDTGIGIPAEEMPRLFERFHRIQSIRSRTHEGSGIGLALVRELIKLHGGSVRAESEYCKGATFIVSLPLGKDHLPPDKIGRRRNVTPTALGASFVEEALRWLPEHTEQEEEIPLARERIPVAVSRVNESAPHVLVADDNADMRQYVSRLLAEHYNVRSVPDGQAALAAVRERRPDLLLSDIMMPRLDGFGLLREIRGDPSLKNLPIILLSARAGDESRLEGFQGGADDYLIKPFSARELLARVTARLELARVRCDAEEKMRYRTVQFETLLNRSPLGVYLVDADFRFRQVNPSALPVFAKVPDLVGRNFEEVAHILWEKRYADEIVRLFRHTLETGESYSTPERIEERLDRNVKEYYEWRIDRIVLPEGSYGVVCYFRDISQQALARMALQENEQRINADLQAMTRLYELGNQCVDRSQTVEQCLRTMLETAIGITGSAKGNIQLLDERSGGLEIAVHHGFEPAFLEFFAGVHPGEAAVCGEALKSMQRIVVEDVTRSEIFAGQPSLEILLGAGVRAVQSTPLKSSTGKMLGMISTHFKVPHHPSERDLRFMDLLARQAADYLERRAASEALHQNAGELQRFNRLMIGRELRMIELKKEVNELRRQQGKTELYPLQFDEVRAAKGKAAKTDCERS